MAELHIASCVVRVRTAALDDVIAAIEPIIGSPISGSDFSGKLVVLLEGGDTGALLDQMDKIRENPKAGSGFDFYGNADHRANIIALPYEPAPEEPDSENGQ
jgi:nitrate reductase NapAB chaperone NapD